MDNLTKPVAYQWDSRGFSDHGSRFRAARSVRHTSHHPVEAFEVVGQANQRPERDLSLRLGIPQIWRAIDRDFWNQELPARRLDIFNCHHGTHWRTAIGWRWFIPHLRLYPT